MKYDSDEKKGLSLDRRQFLALGGAGLAGLWLSPLLAGCDSHVITPFESGSSAAFITPVARFFVQNGGEGVIVGWSEPSFVSTADWFMTVRPGGGVSETNFTFSDILSLAGNGADVSTLVKTIECVLQSDVRTTATGYAGTAWWTGIPLTRLLDEAGLDYSASSPIMQINLTGADGFVNNITTERLRSTELPEPILAYRMNGQELPPQHGFPVRLIIQEGYGYKNVKWLTRIETSTVLSDTGTYQSQGYVNDGIIRVNSRSTTLFDNIAVPSGPTRILGFATSGFAPIERVEVSIDGGESREATILSVDQLAAEGSLPTEVLEFIETNGYPMTGLWTFWEITLDLSSGDHVIEVRATDSAGNAQPLTDDNELDGLTAVTTYRVEVN